VIIAFLRLNANLVEQADHLSMWPAGFRHLRGFGQRQRAVELQLREECHTRFQHTSTDKTHGLGDDGLAWVKGTAAQFAGDTARDPKYAELRAEYHYYYVHE
jgi:hypothetical protein